MDRARTGLGISSAQDCQKRRFAISEAWTHHAAKFLALVGLLSSVFGSLGHAFTSFRPPGSRCPSVFQRASKAGTQSLIEGLLTQVAFMSQSHSSNS